MEFTDRTQAGRELAEHLRAYAGREDVVVLGLPRGGVPVAFEVARRLGAPLDVILVRKLGVPFQPELAMGAIGEDGVRVVNDEVFRLAQVTSSELDAVERAERVELERRALLYRGDAPRQDLTGKVAVVVDDGIATGSTARAACQVARAHGAARVVLAAPVAPPETRWRLSADTDELVVVASPEPFAAVGQFYADFRPTSDAAVVELLTRAREGAEPTSPRATDPPPSHEEVAIPVGAVTVPGDLHVPRDAVGTVLFAHGSGSSRHSPRNREVAAVLNRAGIATLLFDLLTPREELNRANVFDIDLLADRLVEATRWVAARPELADLPIGYFGASTGAAAALWAAARPDATVAAVVSRGGRPDLATPRLEEVRAPTLLVVGGADDVVLGLNRLAAERLRCRHELVVIPGATHLFQEPGTLAKAAEAARDWFRAELTAVGPTARPVESRGPT